MPSEDAVGFDQEAGFQGIYWRDEILQLMFWLLGEGHFEAVVPDDLRPFLETDLGRLEERLAPLVPEGYLDPGAADGKRYRLNALGIEEGRRRFGEEFTPFLGRESHVECGDSACECHASGPACPRLQDSQGAS
jgi:hypothetical protein